jgi:adenylate cyclase
MARKPIDEATWRALLQGTDPGLVRLKRIFRRIPSSPRCKLCESPFGPPGYALMVPLGHRRWAANPALCTG